MDETKPFATISAMKLPAHLGETFKRLAAQANHWKAISERINQPSMVAIGKMVGKQPASQIQSIVASTQSPLKDLAPVLDSYRQSLERFRIGSLQSIRAPQLRVQMGATVAQLSAMADAYAGLLATMNSPTGYDALPQFILPGATRELYVSTALTETLDQQPEGASSYAPNELADPLYASEGLKLLARAAPDLHKAYLGAKYVLASASPDKARQVFTSLREVWNHLLRRLAPNEQVHQWIQTTTLRKDGLLHEGNPTRRARGLFICRELECSPLSEFVQADIAGLTKLIDLLNRLHEADLQLTDSQLHLVMTRSDCSLEFMLRIVYSKP